MAKQELRERALALRKSGESIREIARKLRASKSTISYWCRNIALTREQLDALALCQMNGGARGRLRAAEKKRETRLVITKKQEKLGRKDVGDINKRDLFILGLGLYWGEGYKKGNEECGLTSSDVEIIKTFIMWLERSYSVRRSDLILRVSINSIHRGRIRSVEKFWSQVTGIPLRQFTKASLITTTAKKVYSNKAMHVGTLRVKVRKATNLRRRIIGSLAQVKEIARAS